MDGYEAFAFYKNVADVVLGENAGYARFSNLYHKTKNEIEPVNLLSIYDPSNGKTHVQLYGSSIGKVLFENVNDVNDYIKSNGIFGK